MAAKHPMTKRLTYLSPKLIVVEDIATKGLHKMF